MQSVSATFTTLFEEDAAEEVRLYVNDILFSQSDIISIKRYGGLFVENTLSFGGCFSRMVDIRFLPGASTFPVMAEVRIETRLSDGVSQSEWIKQGTYYIDTRETDYNGIMRITAYDAMLKAEADYTPSADHMTMEACATEIATSMGLVLDSRCGFSSKPSYNVELVTGFSKREILGYIAAAYAGNWVVTEEGKLRLICADTTVDSLVVSEGTLNGYSGCLLSADVGKTFATITGVVIYIDDQHAANAGSTAGRVLEVECPWGTNAMAANILSAVSSISYTPARFRAKITPAYEIGDKISYGGKTYIIGKSETSYSAAIIDDLTTPGEEEINHEYEYASAKERATKRSLVNISNETATLRVVTGQISLEVSKKVSTYTGDSSVLPGTPSNGDLWYCEDSGQEIGGATPPADTSLLWMCGEAGAYTIGQWYRYTSPSWVSTSAPTYITGKWYRYNGSAWVLTEDSQISSIESAIIQNATDITARVEKTHTNSGSNGTEWTLNDTSWSIKSILSGTRTTVLYVDKDGLVVNGSGTFSGTIYASAGEIGNFNIGSAIYGGSHSSMSDSNNGVYLGTDGIQVQAASGTVTLDATTGNIVAKGYTDTFGGVIVNQYDGLGSLLKRATVRPNMLYMEDSSTSDVFNLTLSGLSTTKAFSINGALGLNINCTSYFSSSYTANFNGNATFASSRKATFNGSMNVTGCVYASTSNLPAGSKGDLAWVVSGWS